MEITNGGALIAPQGDVVLGADAGSDGGVDVADPGSTLEARDLMG